jgi:hypothetical protein
VLALAAAAASVHAASNSPNTGSLGASADGTNSDAVTFGPGAVAAGGDQAAVYTGQASPVSNTVIGFQSGLNPASSSPFTIEFWARPTASDNDDAPVSNRVSAGNRSGWIFFQRDAATGWNFRMYNGNAGNLGWDLTGGTATLNAWSHVVATWNGTAAQLYVNGQPINSANGGNGVYNASNSAPFDIGTNDTNASAYTGSVDEVAFYPSALTATQILNHFNAASSPTAGTYQSLVRADGAALQLSNNVPEPSSMLLLGAGAVALLPRRRRA